MAEKSPSYPAVPQPGANAKPNLIAPQYGLPTGFRQMAYGSSDIYGKTYAMVRNSQVQVRRLQSTVTTQYRSGSPVPTAPRPTSNASTSIPYVTNVSATATSAAFGGAGFSKVVVSFSVPSDQRNWKYARVYVKNFQGNPNYVLQGEFTQAPATLMLQATGETIQISVGSRSPFGEVNDFTKAPGTAVTLTTGGGSSAVTSLDGITGAVTLIAGTNITITDNSPSPGDIKIAASGGGTGTVTSVALTMPTEFSVSGSPITTSGTLAVTKANESANLVYAGPSSGAAAAPTFRSLANADLPTSGVTAGSYTNTNVTVNAQGIVTAASNGSGGGVSLTVFDGNFNWTNGQATVQAANRICMRLITIPGSLSLNNIYLWVKAVDGANLYSAGIYNLSGTLMASSAAQHLPSTGAIAFPITGAPVNLSGGNYLLAITGNATTAAFSFGGGNSALTILSSYFPTETSSSGVLPASITVPGLTGAAGGITGDFALLGFSLS